MLHMWLQQSLYIIMAMCIYYPEDSTLSTSIKCPFVELTIPQKSQNVRAPQWRKERTERLMGNRRNIETVDLFPHLANQIKYR